MSLHLYCETNVWLWETVLDFQSRYMEWIQSKVWGQSDIKYSGIFMNVCARSLLPSRAVLPGLPEAHGKGRRSLAPLWWTPRDPSRAGEASVTDSWKREWREGGRECVRMTEPLKVCWFHLFSTIFQSNSNISTRSSVLYITLDMMAAIETISSMN